MVLKVVIGDVHGCYDQLMELIDLCETYNDEPKQYIFLGDYVDRGPDSAKVVQYMIDHPEYICLMGNHEDMMIKGDMMWWQNGGMTTFESYKDLPTKTIQAHIKWMRDLPLYHEDEHRIYVHAGLFPGVPLDEQNASSMLWIRDVFLLSGHDFGKLVVHGHTATSGVQNYEKRVNIDTAGVFGGKFTAALFKDDKREAHEFIQVKGYRKPTKE